MVRLEERVIEEQKKQAKNQPNTGGVKTGVKHVPEPDIPEDPKMVDLYNELMDEEDD